VSARTTTEPESQRPRRAAAGIAACLLLGLSLIAATAGPGHAGAQGAHPNIILLLTDDQEPASMRVMKTVRKELRKKGTTMSRMYANFPLCCPSRATMLTGQYAHNHMVLSNKAPDGGYGVFNERHGDDYLPIWLRNAGYRTAYIGKYLNEYAEPDEYGTLPTDVPRGWDDWRVLAPSRAQYFGYTLNQNGVLTKFSRRKRHYSTDVFTTKAKKFIRRNTAAGGSPFFLMLGYAAPHGGGGGSPGRSCNRAAEPAPRHLGQLRKRKKFRLPPSFNEADVSDKPSSVQNFPYLAANQISDLTRKRRCAWESLLGVDESVGELIAELKRNGELRDTYIFYVSDNGYLRGEHRIRNQKRYLYEESARIPFVARGPGIPRGETSADVVSNADITSTILQLTGARAGRVQDGTSLWPSLTNPSLERGRAILLEAYAGQQILGVRTSRYLYTEWETGETLLGEPERELYDTFVDPYQLNNVANDPAYASIVSDLGAELDRLIGCAGAECVAAPTAQLRVEGTAIGPGGCKQAPLYARLTSPSEEEILTVSFHAGGVLSGEDTTPPFELGLRYGPLRKALPKRGEVTARAVFEDGRRIALTEKVLACG
jgi:arylsulfatase A-like enzyme